MSIWILIEERLICKTKQSWSLEQELAWYPLWPAYWVSYILCIQIQYMNMIWHKRLRASNHDNVTCSTGAWVTASDLPDVLGNLRFNLRRTTRGHCRYTPQVAALSWGYDLEETFPRNVYRYDYVLAADVVYHHDFLDELLATMRHFCQPGTTLIWANKIRFASDLVFTENFTKTFNTTLLADLGEIKIYSATTKDAEVETHFPVLLLEDAVKQEKESEECDSGEISKKQGQYANVDELEELDRDTKQRNVNGTGVKYKEGKYLKAIPNSAVSLQISDTDKICLQHDRCKKGPFFSPYRIPLSFFVIVASKNARFCSIFLRKST